MKSLMFALAFVVIVSGCNSAPSGATGSTDQQEEDTTTPGASGDETSNENDNSQPNEPADEATPPATEDTTPSATEDGDSTSNTDEQLDGPALTDGQAASVQAVTESASAIARAVVAVFPITGAADYISGLGPDFVCPQLDATQDFDTINLTLDYGSGCSTTTFPRSVMKGAVQGDFFFNVDAMSLTLNGFDADGEALEGTVAGGFAVSQDQATFAVNLDVTAGDGLSARGGATVVVNTVTGGISVTTANITVSDGNADPSAVVFEDLVIDPAAASGFLPNSGSATLNHVDASGESVELDVTFVEETPANGSVTVTVDYGYPIAYTPSE